MAENGDHEELKNDYSEDGGYDCNFVEPPTDDLLCKICHYPARDPILTECCGQNFCSYCLERYHQSKVIDHSSCPYCRKEKFQTMPDKRTERYVLNLKVFCPHKHQGCEWVGELRSMEDHVNKNSTNNIGCPFTELQCSNGCGVVMQRRLVEGHLKSECELREVNCEYCNTTGSYQWINSSHQEECPKYPVECPNHCEVRHVRREEMGGHLEECPLTIVECPYAAVGCESVVRRKEQMEHVMRSVGQHMEYNKTTVLGTQNELEKIKNFMNDRLDNTQRELESVKRSLQSRLASKEQELENVKTDLQATRDGLNAEKQAMVRVEKDLQDTKDKLKESQVNQAQLKMAIAEKGRELDEMKKNAEESNKILQEMLQQLMNRLEKTEQSLQHQLQDSTKFKFQVETVFNSSQPLLLNYTATSSNMVIPVVIKQTEFKKCISWWDSPGFYVWDKGYKMCLRTFPKGSSRVTDHVAVVAYLVEGAHDDNLLWPVKGTLTVQLLNQISDNNHSVPVEFSFDGSGNYCQRPEAWAVSIQGVWCYRFMPHKKLSHDTDKKCQYLKDDCVFFRVCSFQ